MAPTVVGSRAAAGMWGRGATKWRGGGLSPTSLGAAAGGPRSGGKAPTVRARGTTKGGGESPGVAVEFERNN